MLERLYSILEGETDPSTLATIFSGEIPTTTLILLALLPICIALFIRELVCWFYKVNGFMRRLNRIEIQLKRVADILELRVQQAPTPAPPEMVEPPLKPSARIDVELKRRDF